MDFHPAANIFPLLEGREFEELVQDISEHGLIEDIQLDAKTGTIIDGRNRYRACLVAGVEPVYSYWEGDDPVSYVLSMNLHRRHLDESQRAMVAAKVANLKNGQRASQICEAVTQQQAANMVNVSKRSVESAVKVHNHGAPELVSAVERGEVAVSTAATVAALPAEEQAELVARGEREILAKAKEIRARQTLQRRVERQEKLQSQEWPANKYRVIYADPPWEYDQVIEQYGPAERHYPTMPTEQICALSVQELALPDSVLFIWTTSPKIEDALQVVHSWGFTYKAMFVWDKVKHNYGHYNSVRHELLFICTRGSCLPDVPELVDSVVTLERSDKHSEKPEYFRELIDKLYPHGPRIELFARKAADGWEAWGNEQCQ